MVDFNIIMPVPSEFSHKFVQQMANRMTTSFYKYGPVRDAYPHNVNALRSLQMRIDKYVETGNTEYLVDAANFAMIEYMCPSIEGSYYTATDSEGSPGRAIHMPGVPLKMNNKDIATLARLLPEESK